MMHCDTLAVLHSCLACTLTTRVCKLHTHIDTRMYVCTLM